MLFRCRIISPRSRLKRVVLPQLWKGSTILVTFNGWLRAVMVQPELSNRACMTAIGDLQRSEIKVLLGVAWRYLQEPGPARRDARIPGSHTFHVWAAPPCLSVNRAQGKDRRVDRHGGCRKRHHRTTVTEHRPHLGVTGKEPCSILLGTLPWTPLSQAGSDGILVALRWLCDGEAAGCSRAEPRNLGAGSVPAVDDV